MKTDTKTTQAPPNLRQAERAGFSFNKSQTLVNTFAPDLTEKGKQNRSLFRILWTMERDRYFDIWQDGLPGVRY